MKGAVELTRVYFVRHAQPEQTWEDDRTRPLTEEGLHDTAKVLDFFSSMEVDSFYSSPYKRSVQTIESTAQYFHKEIIIDERFRERKSGVGGNNHEMFQKRWSDKNFHENGGESIHMVQKRNVAALHDILMSNIGKTIVIGTHGTALSSILNFYDTTFDCAAYLRIIDWMPYIAELDFEGDHCLGKREHLYIQKEFKQTDVVRH